MPLVQANEVQNRQISGAMSDARAKLVELQEHRRPQREEDALRREQAARERDEAARKQREEERKQIEAAHRLGEAARAEAEAAKMASQRQPRNEVLL